MVLPGRRNRAEDDTHLLDLALPLARTQADPRTDGKADRGRRGNGRPVSSGGARAEGDAEGSTGDLDQPAHSG
jgi:hypothetical protein